MRNLKLSIDLPNMEDCGYCSQGLVVGYLGDPTLCSECKGDAVVEKTIDPRKPYAIRELEWHNPYPHVCKGLFAMTTDGLLRVSKNVSGGFSVSHCNAYDDKNPTRLGSRTWFTLEQAKAQAYEYHANYLTEFLDEM
jgi:hypothetical protein